MLSPFCRLKKNSLKLLTSIYTVEFVEIFEEIKNKKLFLCYLKEELKIFKEINVKSDTVFLYVAKINKTQIVTISYHSLFNIWDLSTGICLKTLSSTTSYIVTLVKLNKEQFVHGSRNVKTWDLLSGTCLKTLYFSGVSSLAKIDETKMIIASDCNVELWDLKTESCIKTFRGYDQNESLDIVLKLNEFQIVSGSGDKTIKIWELISGICLITLKGHDNKIISLIKLNKTQIASGSFDLSIKIWNFLTGVCLKRINIPLFTTCIVKLDRTHFIIAYSNKISIIDW